MRRSVQLIMSCLLVLFSHASVQASEPFNSFLHHQIEKSQRRVQTLLVGHQGYPVILGAEIGRMLPMEVAESARDSYDAAYEEALALLNTWPSHNPTDFEFTLKASGMAWRVLQAENVIRWVYLRDTALGVGVMSKVVVFAAWMLLWVRKKTRSESSSKRQFSARLEIIPGGVLDFHSPQGDGTENKLHLQSGDTGFTSPLAERIIACFAARRDHPASLQDHLNVPGGLIEHTARTVEAMSRLVEGHPEDERNLFYLMALAHDLGKLFAYERLEGQWVDRRLLHDRISALMVAGLPELYTDLSPTHREALLLALRYYHNPEELPTAAPPLAYTLLETMHRADAAAYEQEKDLARQHVEGIKPYLWEAALLAIPQLNINRYKGGFPEGFTAGKAVFVLEHALREKTLDHLPPELQQKLPIRRPSGRIHPAWPLLVEVLKEKGILLDKALDRKANPSGLFNINASGTTYKCVAALSQEAITRLWPELAAGWNQCAPYEVRISGGRHGA